MARDLSLPHIRLLVLLPTLLSWLLPAQPGHALNSCSAAYPSAVASFSQGRRSDGSAVNLKHSNPEVLVGNTTQPTDQLALGLGGSVTVRFDTPLANYPAAGMPTITRPPSTPPCADAPVRAMISGSIDGLSFTELATVCDGTTFSLGSFPWVSHLKITDTTNGSDPKFASSATSGFTLSQISGQSCLKRLLCASTPEIDPALADPTQASTLALGPLGTGWVIGNGATFEEYGNGSARLQAEVFKSGATSQILNLVVSFTGRTDSPPAGSPIRLLNASAYVDKGGPIDPSLWYYYRTLNGTVLNAANSSTLLRSVPGSTPAAQLGVGANGHNGLLGVYSEAVAGDASAQGEAVLTFTLRDCPAITPTPIPPDEDDDSRNDLSPIKAGTCQTSDKTDTLAALDQELLLRKESVFRATRILVRSNPSKASSSFQARSRSVTRNLVASAWRAIWQHPWQLRSCTTPSSCTAKSLAPIHTDISTTIGALDAHVSKTIKTTLTRVKGRKSRGQLRSVLTQHKEHEQRFKGLLSTLPVETYECPV